MTMWNATLDRKENEVMRALLTLSAGKARYLASPDEGLALMRGKCDEEGLERTLASLAQDGYFDYIATDRKGEKTYVVELRPKGTAFVRSAHTDRRRFILRLAAAALCGLASALLGLLVKLIVS